MCTRISGRTNHGYALVLVLVAMAVLLVVALEESSRVVREIRVATVRASSEQAFYLAEAGFNKIRAEIIVTGGPEDKYLQPETPQTESFTDSDGHALGTYTLRVTQTVVNSKKAYVVVSDGVLSAGTARRTVSGTISVPGTKRVIKPPGSPSSVNVWVTNTDFDP
jgi:Tfp pilus assembly protein PilX